MVLRHKADRQTIESHGLTGSKRVRKELAKIRMRIDSLNDTDPGLVASFVTSLSAAYLKDR